MTGVLSMAAEDGDCVVDVDVGEGAEADGDGSGLLEAKMAANSLSISNFLDISADDELLDRPEKERLDAFVNVTVLASLWNSLLMLFNGTGFAEGSLFSLV